MTKRRFEFPLRTIKAFENQDGIKHVIAVASDNKLDLYREYFDFSALAEMAESCQTVKENKPTEGLVDLMETHYETFGFGYADDGWINHDKNEDGSNIYELYVDFALKEDFPCGKELYNEIKNNQIVKQLSVGGYIENWSEDTEQETVIFEDDDGNEIEIPVLKIKHFNLEHVAVTPEGWAVNPRTRFETAKGKDLGFMASIYKSLADEGTQKMIQERMDSLKKKEVVTPPEETKNEVTLANIPSIIMTKMVELFKERDGKMPEKVDKTKTLIEEIKGLELTEDEMKELNLSFVPESSESDPNEDIDTPDIGEEIEKAIEPVMEIIKGLQKKIDENKDEKTVADLEKSLTEKFEKIEKASTDKDSVIEELKSKIEKMGEETQIKTDTPAGEEKIDKDKTGSDDKDTPVERTKDNMWEQ